MKYLLSIPALLLILSCNQKPSEKVSSVPSLKLKWETDTLLTTCESVIYDEANEVLYVSNIMGDPSGKDGKGSIGKVDLDGKIIDANWVSGLDAPKGMGLFNGKLYATDIDRIVEIETASGKILNTYPVDSAKFLNDITVDAQGRVYASDSNTKNIVMLENGKVSVWLQLSDGPNGLLAEENRMMVALWDPMSLNTIDYPSNQVAFKTDSLENPDGIEAVGDGGYLVSSWNGQIHYVDSAWKRTRILDTREAKISAADIEYIPAKNLLLIPTFFNNKVMAYELKK